MEPNRGWKNNSLVPICNLFFFTFIIVIRYKEHDQDGDSMIKAYWSELCWVYTVGFIHPYLKTANKPKPWQMGFIVALGKTSSQTDVLKGLRQVGTSFFLPCGGFIPNAAQPNV